MSNTAGYDLYRQLLERLDSEIKTYERLATDHAVRYAESQDDKDRQQFLQYSKKIEGLAFAKSLLTQNGGRFQSLYTPDKFVK